MTDDEAAKFAEIVAAEEDETGGWYAGLRTRPTTDDPWEQQPWAGPFPTAAHGWTYINQFRVFADPILIEQLGETVQSALDDGLIEFNVMRLEEHPG